jgi:4-amino-4-deoxy-L-arabinose transferase-like glycosyltransferase
MNWIKKTSLQFLTFLNNLEHREFLTIGVIFSVALLIRILYIGFFVGFNAPLEYDGLGYNLLATNVLAGKGLVLDLPYLTASRVPGYPLFLAFIYLVFGQYFWIVRTIQAIIGAITCVIILKTGQSAINWPTGLLAGLCASVYPLLLYMSGLFYSETLAMLLLMLGVYIFIELIRKGSWWRAMFSGIFLTLATLTNPLSSLMIPMLILGLFLVVRPFRKSFTHALIFGISCLVVISPWVIRNYTVYNRFIPLSSLAGSNLWSGNNPFADGGFVYPYPEYWTEGEAPDYEYLGWSYLGEAASSSRFSSIAMKWIKDHPGDFLKLLPKKVIRLWSPISYGRQFSRSASSFEKYILLPPYLLFFALALVGIIISFRYWPNTLPLFASILGCNLAALIYYGATRYSISMAPALIIFASLAITRFLERISGNEKPASLTLST